MIGFIATDDVSLNGSPTVSPTTVAACSGVPFLELDLDDLLGVVPRAARVGHEDRLVQAEDAMADQVADEEERLDEREGEREKKIVRKMLNMPFCAYFVQISTTFLLSSADAFSSRLRAGCWP
jgi:hypothetical protein